MIKKNLETSRNINLGASFFLDTLPTAGSSRLVTSGGVKEELTELEDTIREVQEGNLLKETGIIAVDIDITSMTILNSIHAMISNGYLTSQNNYNIRYLQISENCNIVYKLGASSIANTAAIFICDNIPAVNVTFSNGIAQVGNAEGEFTISAGQYLCLQDYGGIETYLPKILKKETISYEEVNVFEELGEKSEESTILADNLWNAIEEVNSNIPTESTVTKKIPYLIENRSYFWMRKLATNFDQNTPFKISGTANSNTLNIISGGQSSSILTSADEIAAIVIRHDDGSCTPHVLVSWTENTLDVYPAISENIQDGLLVPLYNDAQHLTKLGFHCWAEHLYGANPRYCEKNLYIARYAPADVYQNPPFTRIGGGLIHYPAAYNDRSEWNQRYGGKGATYYTAQDNLTLGEYGIEWTVSTGNFRGYLEAMIGTDAESAYLANYGFNKDEGFELHIEVYADNTLVYNYLKTTNYVERICVPFEGNQDNIKLKVYYTKLRAHKESLAIDMVTFWINENKYDSQTLFPKYSIISWFMASWGEYWNDNKVVSIEGGLNDYPEFPVATDFPDTDQGVNYKEYRQGASGEAMRELISKDSGIQVPAYIRSKAGMTTRFGKAWWPFLVQPYHPNIMVTSFGINDHNTNTNPGQYKDVLDPYGNIIDMSTPVTALEYADNIKAMMEMCHANGITFIHAEISIGTLDWIIALENNLSTQVTA